MFWVTVSRQCSRPGCPKPAVATLEFNYAEQVAIIGPLQVFGNPHRWDLCAEHAARTTVPRGWEMRSVDPALVGFHADDDADESELMALMEAVQQASQHVDELPEAIAPRMVRREQIPLPTGHHPARRNLPPSSPRRHLRAVREQDK
ncbi:DUF3499 domain-containing protein [Corynebacterium suicordis]|uniref:DUF3499 domain-containing protein n=1 Tax=Corynebacterium suicordis DSM 45110 TaxID=1121369 RepID=A0ABR9ZHX8_9CORY|nr:DUF3499 domain-containing protein [Corynebacterium suicordis]MBF4553025.1 DUF3499 domain-containing protein [Corynebacterium suicordis DSM 45110]